MKLRICVLTTLTAAVLGLATAAARSTPQAANVPRRAGTVAFIRFENKNDPGGPLFVIRPDGSGLRAVTPRSTTVREYAWSPDGRWIAYVDQRWSLWRVHPDGTGRRLLLPGLRLSTTSLSWSPDGKTIAIASPGSNTRSFDYCMTPATLYLVPMDRAPATTLPVSGVAGCYVAWSPRGNEIAYFMDRGIFVIHPNGSGRRRVPYAAVGAQWSADGRQLLFIHPDRGGDRDGFAVVDADGTHFRFVTTHADIGAGAVWSPQGHRILYGRTNPKGIYVVGENGRHARRVTTDEPASLDFGAWAPDGASIVYETDGTGNGDLYVVGLDGRGKVQLTYTAQADIDPSWAP